MAAPVSILQETTHPFCLIPQIIYFQAEEAFSETASSVKPRQSAGDGSVPSIRYWSHLVLQVTDDERERRPVVALGFGLALQELSDLQLQLGVGLLQAAHLGQVGGQAVVQVLHGHLLVV